MTELYFLGESWVYSDADWNELKQKWADLEELKLGYMRSDTIIPEFEKLKTLKLSSSNFICEKVIGNAIICMKHLEEFSICYEDNLCVDIQKVADTITSIATSQNLKVNMYFPFQDLLHPINGNGSRVLNFKCYSTHVFYSSPDHRPNSPSYSLN